ncbi:FkbM family methyltransferase [Oleiphilus messinensis]|uniref:FkbM family methyltransferase n=1 Tax=Oleiphilus messinensis TaxID=141451 RepID=A0A1Y0I9F6_9GAMM|nr:FkbM family methyltransferase [Oleiphilus messinensis]ARU57148.1 FkbM family methyltransferase [Oleiphilus messinensis]
MSNNQIAVCKVPFRDTELIYEASNDMVKWRAESLYTKEPDTVVWISQFKENDVLVDIGANVGMYTVLAAKGMGARVYAFEPESQNYALLNRNIVYNQIQDKCVAFCMALTDESKVDRLYLSTFGLGGSCHTFGQDIDFNLQQRSTHLAQGCVSFQLDELVAKGVIPQPDHIKIDVDGLEHCVLQGALDAISNPKLKSILVELNTNLPEHQSLINQLAELGFVFDQRQVGVAIRQEGTFKGVGNFIFYRLESGISFEVFNDTEAQSAQLNNVNSTRQAKHTSSGAASTNTASDANIIVIGPNHQHGKQPAVSPLEHMQSVVANMDIRFEPYPHFYVENIFPDDYYRQMMAMKPVGDELISINETGRTRGSTYDNRFVMHLESGLERLKSDEKRVFWDEFRKWFCSETLMVSIIRRFEQIILNSGVTDLNVFAEAMFMRDLKGYSIGPHTDSPARLLTMMLYLPEDTDHVHLGTSVYAPKDAAFRCSGSRHHRYEGFDKFFTAPYKPNSLFGFLKTNNSFHGFEEMQDEYKRDTMVYIVKHKNP